VFTVSHFCEKARWACDRKGMPYRLVTLLPGPHLLTVRRFARRSEVPLLVHGSRVIQGSSSIIDYLDASYPNPPLTPADPEAAAEARAWEALLDRELGETMQRMFYQGALQNHAYLAARYAQGGPFWSSWFYALALPPILRAACKKYKVTPENAAHDPVRLESLFARLDRHFATRRYLAGEHFSRADLTLAALAAGLVHPPEHPAGRFPSRDSPSQWTEQLQRFRDSATAERVRELYRSERHVLRLPATALA
jgi:glutathione S-transferase